MERKESESACLSLQEYTHTHSYTLCWYIQVNQIDFLDAVDSGISSNLRKGLKVLGMCSGQNQVQL